MAKLNEKDYALLHILMEQKEHISGEVLSEQLNVSRTAIWKRVNKLNEHGFVIESITKKGYKLLFMNEEKEQEDLKKNLKNNFVQHVFCHETIDSTNIEAKRIADDYKENVLILSKEQTKGKGRRGRTWESVANGGIYASLLLYPDVIPQDASMLTLVAGLSFVETMENLYAFKTEIKWPNDIVVTGKKLVGILTEMSAESDYVHYVVIGTGINVFQESFHGELKEKATSLYMELGEKIYENIEEKSFASRSNNVRQYILQEFIDRFQQNYKVFQKNNNMLTLAKNYNKYLAHYDKEILLIQGKKEIKCVSKGINERGELQVEIEGKIKAIHSGEVSVKGIYGMK